MRNTAIAYHENGYDTLVLVESALVVLVDSVTWPPMTARDIRLPSHPTAVYPRCTYFIPLTVSDYAALCSMSIDAADKPRYGEYAMLRGVVCSRHWCHRMDSPAGGGVRRVQTWCRLQKTNERRAGTERGYEQSTKTSGRTINSAGQKFLIHTLTNEIRIDNYYGTVITITIATLQRRPETWKLHSKHETGAN